MFTPKKILIFIITENSTFSGGQNASSNNSRQMYLDPPNYMVGIVNENRVDCAGSFIKENFVVTSANCVYR